MLKNQITHLLELDYPIIQSPLPFDLFSAEYSGDISAQGALGMVRISAWESESHLRNKLKAYLSRSDKLSVCFSHELPQQLQMDSNIQIDHQLDLEIPPEPPADFEQLLSCVLANNPLLVGFANGIPDQAILDQIHEAGAKIFAICSNVLEALVCEKLPIDIVVLQGDDAGGERCHFDNYLEQPKRSASMVLLQQCRGLITKPIILWADYSHGADIVSAMIAGAEGVMMDRMLLNCFESELTDEQYQELDKATEFQNHCDDCFTHRELRYIANSKNRLAQIHSQNKEYIYQQYFRENPHLRPLSVSATQGDQTMTLAEKLAEIKQQMDEFLS